MNIILAGPLCKLMWSLEFFSAGSREHFPGLDYIGGFRDKPARYAVRAAVRSSNIPRNNRASVPIVSEGKSP